MELNENFSQTFVLTIKGVLNVPPLANNCKTQLKPAALYEYFCRIFSRLHIMNYTAVSTY